MNISDVIAAAIQSMIEAADGNAIIKRNELANRLGCVPSQINYVITSRFTQEQGYIIESKRGGGGFIRITKVGYTKSGKFTHVVNSIGGSLDENTARIIIENLCYDNFLQQNEVKLLLSSIPDRLYRDIKPQQRDAVRANIFKSMLLNLI